MAADAGPHWPRWWLLVTVGVLGCFESNDGDLGFHLATGREIMRSGRIPSRNVLSYTEPEHPWLLHQGLPAWLFEWLWRHAGAGGLMALKLAVLMATWTFAYASARALRVSPYVAACACACAAAVSAFRFELRPYLFTHLCLAVIVWACAALTAGALRLRRAQLLAAGAVFVGCQLHAGAIDSVLVLCLYAAGATLSAQLHTARACASAALLGLVAAALCLSVYHPLGARVLLFPWQMATHPYWGEHLVEFRHAWRVPLASLWLYWLWLAGVAVAAWQQRRTLHAGLGLATLGFALLSLWYVRTVFAFALVSLPLVALALRDGSAWLERVWTSRPRLAPTLTLLTVSLLAIVYVYRDHQLGVGFSSEMWPVEQFRFVRQHALRGNAFVSDAWAGPFLGEFYPERRAFFDNRLEAYSDQLARDVYQRVRYGEPGWDHWLDHYDVQFLVLRYTTPGEARFRGYAENLRQKLARDARFALVYFDDAGELFVRSAGDNAALARDHAIVGVDPDRRTFLGRPAAAAPALLRAAESGMHSQTVLGMTALALADAGDLIHARALADALHQLAPDDPFTHVIWARLARPPAR